MNHLWNMGDGGWVETRKDGHYLCSSYTSTKGFTRGNTTSSEKKLSEEEYKDLLEKEEAWNLIIQAEGEIHCEGNFITYVPRKKPISEIEAVNFIE